MSCIGIDIGERNLAIFVWEHGSKEARCYLPNFVRRKSEGFRFEFRVLDFLKDKVKIIDAPCTVRIEKQRMNNARLAKIQSALTTYYYVHIGDRVSVVCPPSSNKKISTYKKRKLYSVTKMEACFGKVPEGVKADDIADAFMIVAEKEEGFCATTLTLVIFRDGEFEKTVQLAREGA